MGFAQVLSRAQAGLTAPAVAVEVHLGSGLPTFSIVGLPAAAIKESRERVRAALAHCGFELPAGRITVSLAPADLPKEGGRFDLPIALGILLASGQVELQFDLARTEFYGELGLTGELKPVSGLLLAALHAARVGHRLVVPASNASEVRVAEAEVHGLTHLRELIGEAAPQASGQLAEHRRDDGQGAPSPMRAQAGPHNAPPPDLADVRGQHQAKRALLIAAAGGHSLLMCGPPGSGKTMLAQRLPGLLPALSPSEALEVAAIAAVAQSTFGSEARGHWPDQPPFRAPHHTASAHAIIGGGGSGIQPGEVSLAHHGVLFLDELPEFDRRVLESLREPLESGRVSVVRTTQRADFPAAFLLVAAMNPCPCGRHGLVSPPCRCNEMQIQRYRSRISGPLLDRIDLQINLGQVEPQSLVDADAAKSAGPDSAAARDWVMQARQRQLRRQGCLNARLHAGDTLRNCRAERASLELLARFAQQQGTSARSQHRILRVARSIADLAQCEAVRCEDMAEALALRLHD